jgi:hypothetical protein
LPPACVEVHPRLAYDDATVKGQARASRPTQVDSAGANALGLALSASLVLRATRVID